MGGDPGEYGLQRWLCAPFSSLAMCGLVASTIYHSRSHATGTLYLALLSGLRMENDGLEAVFGGPSLGREDVLGESHDRCHSCSSATGIHGTILYLVLLSGSRTENDSLERAFGEPSLGREDVLGESHNRSPLQTTHFGRAGFTLEAELHLRRESPFVRLILETSHNDQN